jgi:triacylglycerol lipase
MGVQTARTLIALLDRGSRDEQRACPGGVCPGDDGTPPSRISALFDGSGRERLWVHALGSLSGANDGSTAAHLIQNQLNPNELISVFVKLFNTLGGAAVYDVKLDQFGLAARQPGETLADYVQRVTSTLITRHNRDTAVYDLSLEGAAALNEWTPAHPEVFYFSWTNGSSFPWPFTHRHQPMFSANPWLWPTTSLMGRYLSAEWWENDGVVNTVSMTYPKLGSRDRCDDHAAGRNVEPGLWHVVGRLRGWDHWDILGLLDPLHSSDDVVALYQHVAATLRGD